MYSLIAALVKGKAESLMGRGLKRLRWMFLGYLPDFIAADEGDGNGATTEVLDPNAVGAKEVEAVFARISEAHLHTDPKFEVTLHALAEAYVELVALQVDGSNTSLVRLQAKTSEFAAKLLDVSGKDE